ncbi:LOW QUALITY PROTEIN: hypothetical protein ACHAXR_003428, partial [Thalassiosira sp. AJA248-18]
KGAYAHLNQRTTEKDLDEAVHSSSSIIYYDDLMHLAVLYEFLLARLPEPPDGLLKSALSLGLIFLVYSLMIFKGILRLWLRLLSAYFFQIDARNIFVRYGCKRRRKPRPLPTLHIKMFATNANIPDDNAFSWDTDGIPFVVDNSTTGIISNVRKLFVGPRWKQRKTTQTKTVFLIQTPPSIFLGFLFWVNSLVTNLATSMRWMVQWSAPAAPNLISFGIAANMSVIFDMALVNSQCCICMLVLGTGYFKAFTTRIQRYFGDKVHYAFSSAFSLEPTLQIGNHTNLDAMIGPEGDTVDENPIYQWYCPETCDSVTPSKSSDSSPDSNLDSNPGSNCSQFDFK